MKLKLQQALVYNRVPPPTEESLALPRSESQQHQPPANSKQRWGIVFSPLGNRDDKGAWDSTVASPSTMLPIPQSSICAASVSRQSVLSKERSSKKWGMGDLVHASPMDTSVSGCSTILRQVKMFSLSNIHASHAGPHHTACLFHNSASSPLTQG